MALHGTPGSRLKFASLDAAAGRHGLRLICPDRWGYGGTDAPAVPVLDDYGDDLVQLADALGLVGFSLLGVSGGGPFAAAAAHRCAARVRSLALVGPVGVFEPGTSSRVGPFHRLCFQVVGRSPKLVRVLFGAYRRLLMAAPRMAIRLASAKAPAHDRAILQSSGFSTDLAAAFLAGLPPGAIGPAVDMQLFACYERAAGPLQCHARVWLGTRDGNIPHGPARILAKSIRAEIIELADRGHYWLSVEPHDVLSWIAENSR